VWQGEIINRRKDGTLYTEISTNAAVLDEDGQIVSFVQVKQDISQRKEMETRLQQAMHDSESANRAKSAFLANMSHELRTPMNAIIGYSEMLVEDAEDEEYDELIPDMNKINSAGRHLLALINDILDLSKIEAGRMDLYLEWFELTRLLSETEATVAPLMGKNNNEFIIDAADNLSVMRADLTKVRQSITNLLSNAAKFTDNGMVTLAARRENRPDGDWIVFDVSDTGIGIPEDKLEHIFGEFTQADDSTTRNYGGTGLGLVISRRFCRMMGGDITVTSEVGAGSTFTVALPAEVEAATISEAASDLVTEEILEHLPDADHPVLVIDDDPDARELLRRTLEADGYPVATAGSGEEGLALARRLKPSLITLDLMMPVMAGFDFAYELRQEEENRGIPIIVITSKDLNDEDRGRLSGGVERIIEKGAFTEEEMLEQIRDMVAKLSNGGAGK
jgi:signal transduction histidine kinase/CheY-like chemotaxis protein